MMHTLTFTVAQDALQMLCLTAECAQYRRATVTSGHVRRLPTQACKRSSRSQGCAWKISASLCLWQSWTSLPIRVTSRFLQPTSAALSGAA